MTESGRGSPDATPKLNTWSGNGGVGRLVGGAVLVEPTAVAEEAVAPPPFELHAPSAAAPTPIRNFLRERCTALTVERGDASIFAISVKNFANGNRFRSLSVAGRSMAERQ